MEELDAATGRHGRIGTNAMDVGEGIKEELWSVLRQLSAYGAILLLVKSQISISIPISIHT